MEKELDKLELDSRLSELSRVWPWAEALATEHALGEQTRFAMHLCMEEGLSNVIMHGYRSQPGHPIVIRASVAGGWLSIAIEDEAPPFAPAEPVDSQPAGRPADLETIEPGGNGIRLMRRFAAWVNYEPLPRGNRLTIGFPVAAPDGSRDVSAQGSAESPVSQPVSERN